MTILLSGSNGQLGKSIIFSSKNKYNIVKINKEDLDNWFDSSKSDSKTSTASDSKREVLNLVGE